MIEYHYPKITDTYPLQPEMTKADIIKPTPKELHKHCMALAKIIDESYVDTEYKVDMEKISKILMFVLLLNHTGGSLAGVPFRLLPFQAEFIIQVLGVVRRDTGLRKHKEVCMHIPRKAGKTELSAALNLVMLFMDKEAQKEIYSIASETQQAAILYHAAVSMLKQSPTLLKRIKQYKAEKKLEVKGRTFVDLYRVLSAVAGTKDGLKTSTVFADEPHAYPDSALYDVVAEGMAHREQPLAIMLSTAGYNKQGFYYRKLQYFKQVMTGVIDDPSVYLMYFAVEDDEDWTDEENWKRVNPALGYGVKMDYLRDKFHKALHSATEEVSFKTKHLNMFVDSAITWIRHTDWEASNQKEINEEDLIGRECYAGLDLASTTDLTAFVLVFPNDDGSYDVLPRFFIPEDTAAVRSKEDRVSYLDWIREGNMIATTGNVIDYEEIYTYIKQDLNKFDVREIAFDRWNALSIITKLEEDGVTCVGFGQGFKSMSSPVKAIESLVLQKQLNHGNHPVLTWNVANVQIITDAAENVKMDKSKAVERIDGAVALAMAIGRAETYKDETADWESLIG